MAVYYSKELKQYSGEMFFSIVLVLLSMQLIRKRTPPLIASFLLTALVAIAYGVPLILLVAAISMVVFVRFYLEGEKKKACAVAAGMMCLGLVEILTYFLWLRPQVSSQTLYTDLRSFFPPDAILAIPRWLANCAFSFFNYDFRYPTLLLGPTMVSFACRAVFCLGVVYLFVKRQRALVYIYCVTMSFLVVLSFMNKWPLGGSRVNLFLLPFHLTFLAKGIELITATAVGLCSKSTSRWAVGTMGVLCFLPVQTLDENLWHLKEKEEMRPVVEYVKNQFDPRTQRIYLYNMAREPFRYYWSLDARYDDDTIYYVGIRSRHDPSAHEADIADCLKWLPETAESIYVILSHVRQSEHDIILGYFRDRLGDEVGSKKVKGAYAYLFEVPKPAPAAVDTVLLRDQDLRDR